MAAYLLGLKDHLIDETGTMGEKGGEEAKVLQFFIMIHVTTALFVELKDQ